MNGADEVNMGTNGVVLKMKENPKSQLKETEDEPSRIYTVLV